MMSLAENEQFDKSASIAFDSSNANGLSPNPYTSRKREQIVKCRNVLSFSACDVFAIAKVKLLRSEVCTTHK